MPITTEYPRFVPFSRGGVISNRDCDAIFLPECDGSVTDRYAAGACEDIVIGGVSKSQAYHRIAPPEACTGSVCCLSALCQPKLEETLLVAGYTDGWVRLLNYITAEEVHVYRAHTSDVTVTYLPQPHAELPSEWLFTAGKDTEITVFHRFKERGFRLRGHTKPISALQMIYPVTHTLMKSNILLSSDRDGVIKFWHLELRHCFKTLTGHPGPVWDMIVSPKQDRLLVGGQDQYIRVWKLTYPQEQIFENGTHDNLDGPLKRPRNDDLETSKSFLLHEESLIHIEFYGSLSRESEKRVQRLRISGDLLLCQTLEKQLQLFHYVSDEARRKKQSIKKLKKARMKLSKLVADGQNDAADITNGDVEVNPFEIEFQAITIKLNFPSQVRACDIVVSQSKFTANNNYRVLSSHSLNYIILNNVILKDKRNFEVKELYKSADQGFRQPPIASSFLHNDMTICAMDSTGAIKLFAPDFTSYRFSSVVSQKEWGTASDKAICFVVIHTNDHCAIGYQSGLLRIVHIRTGSSQWENAAHNDRVNSICLTHVKRHLISVSNDKRLCVWRQTRKVLDKDNSLFRLALELQKETTLKHEILVVATSPDERFVLAALSDNTVQALFFDTLKPTYTLYGFHMPVECMAVSSDSQILATGSQDRIIRIWSLQHGTMERMLEKSTTSRITGLSFVPNSPILFSCDSTGIVRQWNAQKFHMILTLEGHKAACNSVCVSHDGKHIVTCSQDYSLRVWEESATDVVVLEDEAVERQLRQDEQERLCHEELIMPGVDSEEATVGVLAKKTANTLRSEDFLREALDLLHENDNGTGEADGDKARETSLAKHPLLMAHNCEDFEELLMIALLRIRRPELELCVAALPWLPHAYRLLCLLPRLLKRCPWRCCLWTEVATMLVHVHSECLLSNAGAVPAEYRLYEDNEEEDEGISEEDDNNSSGLARVLAKFRTLAEHELERQKKIIGFNMAALEYGKVMSIDNNGLPF